MLFSEAVDEMMLVLGERTDPATRTKCATSIKRAQAYLEHNWINRPLPWFLVTERETTNALEDEERIPIPADFIEEYEQDGLWIIDDNGGEHLLKKYDADDLRRSEMERTDFGTNDPSTTDTLPTSYALTGKYFRLFPKPNRLLAVKMMYYGTRAVLVDDSDENEWLKFSPYVLIGWAGERLATGLRDKNAAVMFGQWKQGGIMALDVKTSEMAWANRRAAMGETA